MKATADFSATINGTTYALKKGEEFKGDERAAQHLANLGFIAQAKGRKAKEKEEE